MPPQYELQTQHYIQQFSIQLHIAFVHFTGIRARSLGRTARCATLTAGEPLNVRANRQ